MIIWGSNFTDGSAFNNLVSYGCKRKQTVYVATTPVKLRRFAVYSNPNIGQYLTAWLMNSDTGAVVAGSQTTITASESGLASRFSADMNLVIPAGNYKIAFGVSNMNGLNRKTLTNGYQTTTTQTVPDPWDGATNYSFDFSFYAEIDGQYIVVNSGNPVQAGQTAVPVALNNYSVTPTAVTCTYASGAKSLTCSNISGNSSAITFDLEDRSEGVDYPAIGDALLFTVTYTTESAQATTTLAVKTGEQKLTFESAIIDDPTSLGYRLDQDGFTVEGGEIVLAPFGDLDFDPEDDGTTDGIGSSSTLGSFPSWFRPATGTGAGNVYYYYWTINGSGEVVSASKFIGSTIKGSLLAGSLLKGKLL